MSNTLFAVYHPMCVDRPEFRNDSFHPVQAGTVVPNRTVFADHANAIAFYNSILEGADDFASEYVRAVYVHTIPATGRVRVVRKRVERERIPGTDAVRAVAPH